MAKRTINYIFAVILSASLLLALIWLNKPKTISIKGVVLPHHLLVEKYIDQFYQEISQENPQVKTIILLSPNHFGYGLKYFQTTDQTEDPEFNQQLEKEKIHQLVESKTASLNEKQFNWEHGLYVHYPFIKKYFPQSKVIPIKIKQQGKVDVLNRLIEALNKVNDDQTLIIASIDFSHQVDEKIAINNDQKIRTYLEELSTPSFDELINLAKTEKDQSNPEAVAMDSPETMYVFLNLIFQKSQPTFEFWKRTSTASLTSITDPLQNTSHLFLIFKK